MVKATPGAARRQDLPGATNAGRPPGVKDGENRRSKKRHKTDVKYEEMGEHEVFGTRFKTEMHPQPRNEGIMGQTSHCDPRWASVASQGHFIHVRSSAAIDVPATAMRSSSVEVNRSVSNRHPGEYGHMRLNENFSLSRPTAAKVYDGLYTDSEAISLCHDLGMFDEEEENEGETESE